MPIAVSLVAARRGSTVDVVETEESTPQRITSKRSGT
jgi:hypothetical protein